MIKCIIFDCDGTLVDSEYLSNLGLEIKLREYDIESSANDLVERFKGGKLSNTLETIESEYNIRLNNDFIPSYRLLVEELFEQHLKPCEGVKDLLEKIKLPMCVASNGPLNKIKKSLAITGLSEYFGDNLFSSYEVNSWKPNPEIFLHSARQMGFHPKECAAVEDSPVGIAAAIAADMCSILYDPNDLHDNVLYTHKIQHISELHDVII